MAEQLNLTAPVIPPAITSWRVKTIALDRGEVPAAASVDIGLIGPNGERKGHRYSGLEADALIRQLNTANLSTQSLERRVLLRLVADGVLAGTITGAPD